LMRRQMRIDKTETPTLIPNSEWIIDGKNKIK
jgi:hypothetical protein